MDALWVSFFSFLSTCAGGLFALKFRDRLHLILGFTAGVGLYLSLPAWGIAVAALVAVGLNVLAETVSLSRLIEAAPPLRWFDRLGRMPSNGPSAEGRAEGREG